MAMDAGVVGKKYGRVAKPIKGSGSSDLKGLGR